MKLRNAINEAKTIDLKKFGIDGKFTIDRCEAERGDELGDFDLIILKGRFFNLELMLNVDGVTYDGDIIIPDANFSLLDIYASSHWKDIEKILRIFKNDLENHNKVSTEIVEYILTLL